MVKKRLQPKGWRAKLVSITFMRDVELFYTCATQALHANTVS